MDFDFSEDQRLLKDSVDRLIADRYSFESRRGYLKEPNGWSAEMWAQYAELGLLGLPFSEDLGGFGGGQIETAQVMEAFGRGLVLEPYLATVVLGGGLLRHAGSEEQQAELVPQIIAGDLKLALAHVERHSRWNLNDVAVTATKDGSGYVVNGEKSVVIHGDCAGQLLVTARTGGAQRDRGGIGLFLVDAADAGVSRKGYPTQDGLRAAEISFANARGVAVGDPGNALPVVERVVDEAIAAVKVAHTPSMMPRNFSRWASRLALPRYCAVRSGSCSTLSQKVVHSRSCCTASTTCLPSPQVKGP